MVVYSSTFRAAVLFVSGVSVDSAGFPVGFWFFWGGDRPLRSGQLVYSSNSEPLALHYYHHLPFHEEECFWDSLKSFSVKAQPEYMVSVHRSGGGSKLLYIFHVFISSQIRCDHVS